MGHALLEKKKDTIYKVLKKVTLGFFSRKMIRKSMKVFSSIIIKLKARGGRKAVTIFIFEEEKFKIIEINMYKTIRSYFFSKRDKSP